jgi:hypothetical protein
MNPEEELALLEDIVDQIMRGVKEMLMAGEIIPEDFQLIIAQELNLTADRIDELKVMLKAVQGPGISPEPLTEAMPSSNISAFAYDPESQALRVQFLGKFPNRGGPIYQYGGVPKQIFDLFQRGAVPARTNGKNKWGEWWKGKVPSIGASLYTLLKTAGYPYQRLT